MMSSTISEESNEFVFPPDSPGSSVSTRLQEEYDELLRFAVVVPSFDPNHLPKALQDMRGSFPQSSNNQTQQTEDGEYNLEDEYAELGGENAGKQTRDLASTTEDMGNTRESHQSSEQERADYQESVPTTESLTISDGSGQPSSTMPKLATMQMGDPLKAKLFMRPDSPSSTLSCYSQRDLDSGSMAGDNMGFTVSVDQDITRMESLLDQWTGDLKRNVLAEFGQSKIKLIGYHKKQAQKEREKHMAELQRLHSEMDSLRELLHTYEQSVERKDQVIANLTHALQKQREKFDMLRTFSEWKISLNDKKREVLASKLAEKHYHRQLMQKCWDGWHSLVESKWRERVEKACQSKAQEVCMSLTNDYETKIASLNEALESSRNEVLRLHAEREQYEESMKKAFMRGVCALNMEAMAIFQDQEEKGSDKCADSETGQNPQQQQQQPVAPVLGSQTEEYYSMTVPQEPVYSSNPPGAPAPRVVSAQACSRGVVVGSKIITSQAKSGGAVKVTKSKTVTAKLTGNINVPRGSVLGNPTLAPPMSSVVVERHQPVVKQTVGQATASRYLRAADGQSQTKNTVQRKIAGQHPQAVKIVE